MSNHLITYMFSLFLILIHKQGLTQVSGVEDGFIRMDGIRFMLNGSPFYANGFNAYWLMAMASNPSERYKVTLAFQEAVASSLVIGRTWAFSDGESNSLQPSPGVYNENWFQGLDFVIWEAKRFGVKLILSLVNNFEGFGGKPQYVKWGREYGEHIPNDDGFYTNPIVKKFYKNHIKSVLTRVNSFTGIAYKDDPTIMAWELMNEPRCQSDPSGVTIHNWIAEMAPYLKSIDRNHLLEVGTEGWYGPYSLQKNPNSVRLGSDFISENQIHDIDFVAFHAYTKLWLFNSTTQTYPSSATELKFLRRWVNNHIRDATHVLRKPILLTEFGKSVKDPGYKVTQRDALLNETYSAIYKSASVGGAAAGFLFWQQLVEGMDSFRDGYEIILSEPSTTVNLITRQSKKLSLLRTTMLS